MNGTAYAVFKFHVLHVIKENAKTEPMQSGEWLTNRTIEVTHGCNSMTSLYQDLARASAVSRADGRVHSLHCAHPPAMPGDYAISTRDESSVYRSASGHSVAATGIECRYEELLADCVRHVQHVRRHHRRAHRRRHAARHRRWLPRVRLCWTKASLRVHARFCDLHTVAIVVWRRCGAWRWSSHGVTFLYRRYRRRQAWPTRSRVALLSLTAAQSTATTTTRAPCRSTPTTTTPSLCSKRCRAPA
jgi:hypothetical protein